MKEISKFSDAITNIKLNQEEITKNKQSISNI